MLSPDSRQPHVADAAHAYLTHLALQERYGEKGEKHIKTKPPLLPPISQLRRRMRQPLCSRAAEDAVKASQDKPAAAQPVCRPALLRPQASPTDPGRPALTGASP